MSTRYDRFWEMRRGGPYTKKPQEIFKCKDCGAETVHPAGFNGEPDEHNCHPGCKGRGDWKGGCVSNLYKENYDSVFRRSPKNQGSA